MKNAFQEFTSSDLGLSAYLHIAGLKLITVRKLTEKKLVFGNKRGQVFKYKIVKLRRL